MELENDVAVSGEPEGFIDAEQEDAADLPVVEDMDAGTEGFGDDADGMGFGEEGEDARDSGEKPGDDAGAVGRQPDKTKQNKAEDSKYAAARRDAERAQKEAEDKARQLEERANAGRERMDAFAREHGYADWTAFERAERVRMYIRNGATAEMANQMAEQTEMLAQMRAEKNRAEGPTQDDMKWEALVSAFPETRRMENLPEEVMAAIAGGESPAAAYRDYKLRQLEAENEALKQNYRNRSKTVGSVKGKGALPANHDAFVNGLYGS